MSSVMWEICCNTLMVFAHNLLFGDSHSETQVLLWKLYTMLASSMPEVFQAKEQLLPLGVLVLRKHNFFFI